MMKPVFLKFPSGQTFLVISDIEKARDNKHVFFLFFNEEILRKNFELNAPLAKKDCIGYYASPTKIGIRNVTKQDGNYYLVLFNSDTLKSFFDENVFPLLDKDFSRDYLILSEEAAERNQVVEIPENSCSIFYLYVLDRFVPVSFSPFVYHQIDFRKNEAGQEILSLGNEMDFTISYLENDTITVSPCFGELASLYEIDAMDIFVNNIMGHSRFKNLSIVKDQNSYSMISEYTRRFPHVANVSHVYSHMASVLFDNGFSNEKGIGVIYDSVSYDTADQILGGEILYGSIGNFQIAASWKPVPLPGGDIANIEPWRIALAITKEIVKGDISTYELPMIRNLNGNPNYAYIFKAINEENITYSPSSSMHHIIAALGEILAYEEATYDFDFFENKMDHYFIDKYSSEHYWIPILEEDDKYVIDTYDLFKKIISDLFAKMDPTHLVYKAILSISVATADMVEKVSKKYNEKKVFLSGEFFKHPHFLTVFYQELTNRGFEVYIPKRIPIDDSGVSVGQLIYKYFEKK